MTYARIFNASNKLFTTLDMINRLQMQILYTNLSMHENFVRLAFWFEKSTNLMLTQRQRIDWNLALA